MTEFFGGYISANLYIFKIDSGSHIVLIGTNYTPAGELCSRPYQYQICYNPQTECFQRQRRDNAYDRVRAIRACYQRTEILNGDAHLRRQRT